jgi:Ca2+-binding EF-hand superfamily protein
MKLALAAVTLTVAAPLFAQAAPRPVSRAEFLKANTDRFAAIDINKDGKIDRKEMAAAQQRELATARQRLQQQLAAKFQQLDTNKNGSLSLAEFQAAMPNISTSETSDQLLARLDGNKNGTVDANEFRAPDLTKFNRADKNKDGVVTPAEARAAAGQR